MQTEDFELSGTIDSRITETGEITVPASTCEVSKLEIASPDPRKVYRPAQEDVATGPIEVDVEMTGYEYSEKGTCVVVEAWIEQTVEMSMMGQKATKSMTLHMKLAEHTR